MERLRRVAVPLASGIAYALTAARNVQGGDSGELAAVGAVGGVAHPPGYPLFVLWSRALSWMPAQSPAHRVALTTAIASALAIFLVEHAARAWGARPISASLSAAVFAVSPLAWRLATVPEVFMLNVALAGALVAAAAPAPWAREDRRAVVLALLAGLGIANHHSVVLLAPLGLFAWARAVRATERRAFAIGASVAAFAIGLLPYAYLVAAARSDCAWGDTTTLRGLLHHFLRVDYGTTKLAASEDPPEPLGQLVLLGRSFVESGIALPLAAAVVRRRWSWSEIALTSSLLVAGPLFVSRFNLPPHGVMAHVVERFHLLPLALASVLGARGIDAIVDLMQSPLAKQVATGGAITAILVRGAMTGADVVAEHRPTTERYLRNVLSMLPKGSVLISTDDDSIGGFEYFQCALGERPDVVVIAPSLLLTEPYARRVESKLGFAIEHGHRSESGPVLDATRLTEQLVLSSRPLFVTKWMVPSLAGQFPSFPIGPLIRVARRPSDVPAPPVLLAENEELYGRLILDDTPPLAHTWAGARYLDYARPWRELAKAFERDGDEETARRCQTRAARFLPLSLE